MASPSSGVDSDGDGKMHAVGPSLLLSRASTHTFPSPAPQQLTARTQSSPSLPSLRFPSTGSHDRRAQRPSLPSLLTNNAITSEAGGNPSSPKLKAGSQFLKVKHSNSMDDGHQSAVQSCRRGIKRIQKCLATDLFLGLIILVDVWLGCYAIDLNASANVAPSWVTGCSMFFFGIYTVELLATLFVSNAVIDRWIVLDAAVVLAGALELVVSALGASVSSMNLVRFLRIFRMARLLRIFRKLPLLKELQKLVKMTIACSKILFWSFVFCFMVMTCWSMAAVELLNPLMTKLASEGEWPDCPQCSRSFLTVMEANLTFFKTIVAGDSWGLIAVPLITAYPWTALIFIGASLTVVFGVLNLVVAVMVDELAEQRQRNVTQMAQELDDNDERDVGCLRKIFAKIDEDMSGELSLEELITGARKVPEFRDRLRVMDIDDQDLEQLFRMLDHNQTGMVSPDDFINALSRWINESKTASRFVKYNLTKGFEQQEEFQHMLTERLDDFERRLFGTNESLSRSVSAGTGAEETCSGVAEAEGAQAADALQNATKALEEAIRTAGKLLQDSGDAEAFAGLQSAHQACQVQFQKIWCNLMPGSRLGGRCNSIGASDKSASGRHQLAVEFALRISGEHASCHADWDDSRSCPPDSAPSIPEASSVPQMLRGPDIQDTGELPMLIRASSHCQTTRGSFFGI
ncbi:unnamed protein product [Polarella glacialis]|uniref:EF-hand domain-containing protein n=1 Tax=Polarella glacialis TaxID=89957 RepID=A0A813KFL6_POLGL|nr:unnamed protein product [Polarella glacialis]